MNMGESCPCPNLECPNHGYCDRCNSRHVRKGYLSYCAFHTILPSLRKAMDADPKSTAALTLGEILAPQLEAYEALKEKFGLAQEDLDARFVKVSRHSDY